MILLLEYIISFLILSIIFGYGVRYVMPVENLKSPLSGPTFNFDLEDFLSSFVVGGSFLGILTTIVTVIYLTL